MSSSDSAVDPVDALAEEALLRLRRGERPTVEEYCRRHPELADGIRAIFPALLAVEQLRPVAEDATGPYAIAGADGGRVTQLGDYRVLREVGRGGMGVVYEAEQVSLGRHVALKVLPAQALLDTKRLARFEREARAAARLHHTNIVPVYGVGSDAGLHYFVMQFIQGHPLDEVLRELQRLRQGEPGEPSPASVVASRLLSGEPGPDVVAASPSSGATAGLSSTGASYWRSVARVAQQAASALAYAHAQGVLHRDVKPSNLLLDLRGNVWVTDFGLAKADDSDDLTGSGDVVGTLRYMAPERFEGKADARSDVYALGLTLYEMVTLRPAFAESDRQQLIRRVLEGEAAPPRSLDTTLPRDLETVVLKAIARDPAARYASAAEMADDLARFAEDRPIRARRIGPLERLWRWCRRNPALAASLALTALALVTATVSATLFALVQGEKVSIQEGHVRDLRERDEKLSEALGESNRARSTLRHELYASQLNLLKTAWDEADVAHARELHQKMDPKLRGFEWHYWGRMLNSEVRVWRLGEFDYAAWTTADRWVAMTSKLEGSTLPTIWDDQVRQFTAWDLASNKALWTYRATVRAGMQSAGDGSDRWRAPTLGWEQWVSLDGRVVALWAESLIALPGCDPGLADRSSFLQVREMATGKVLFRRPGGLLLNVAGEAPRVYFAMVEPVVSGLPVARGPVREVWVWDGATGKESRVLTLPAPATTVHVTSDGRRIITGAREELGKRRDDRVDMTLWDGTTGKEVHRWKREGVGTITLSADGSRLAEVVRERGQLSALLRDTANGKELARLTLATTSRLAWAVDGDRFGADVTLRLSHDGSRLLARLAGNRRRDQMQSEVLQVWDTAAGKELWSRPSVAPGGRFTSAFSRDGWLLALGDRTAISLCRTDTGEELARLRGHTGTVDKLSFKRDDSQLMSEGRDGTLRAWDVSGSRTPRRGPEGLARHLPSQSMRLGSLAETWFRDGLTVTTMGGGNDQGGSTAWVGAGDGREGNRKMFQLPSGYRVVAANRGVTRLVLGRSFSVSRSNDPRAPLEPLLVYDRSGKRLFECASPGLLPGPFRLPAVAFSPDGTKLMADRLLDGTTGRELFPNGEGPRGGHYIAFSPDGQWLAVARGPDLAVWNTATGRKEHQLLTQNDGRALFPRFSPDGAYLATIVVPTTGGQREQCRRAQVWEVRTGRLALEPDHSVGARDSNGAFAFSPDSKRIVLRGTLRQPGVVFEMTTGRKVVTLASTLGEQAVAFSPDGKRIATSSVKGIQGNIATEVRASIWCATTGRELLRLPTAVANGQGPPGYDGPPVAFTTDGLRLVVPVIRGTAFVWDARPARP